MKIFTQISAGELLDKVSILKIKKEKISDEEKLVEVEKELAILLKICDEQLEDFASWADKIKETNEILWKIEDNIREKERGKSFDREFIELARSVYVTNDLRFKIKDEINSHYGSDIKEQKSYEKY